jgi:hypothetical protein
MYAVASGTLAQAQGLPLLNQVGRAFFVVALSAWTLVLLGLTRRAFD